MFILAFLSTFLILSRGKIRRNIDGYNGDSHNWDPLFPVLKDTEQSSNYDITSWVMQLHLQQCAFVEIGEGFCALFVEVRNVSSESSIFGIADVFEFFLGLCNCATLHSWDLCSTELRKQRKFDCIFAEGTPYSNTSARVHRRLCDVTLLSKYAPNCNCSVPLGVQQLHKTEGFPTCFLNPLPDSLCTPRGVCGIAWCSTTTIKGIHTVRCAPNCHQKQPFCEEIGARSSIPPAIYSVWSRWSVARCNNTCGKGLMVEVAVCHNQVTGEYAVDCIAPGFFCCAVDSGKCYCEINADGGIMRVTRFSEPCISIEGCTSSDMQTFTFEGEHGPGNSIDFDEIYNDDNRESFKDTLDYSEPLHLMQRRLLDISYRDDEYKFYDSGRSNRRFKRDRVYRDVLRNRLHHDTDYEAEDDENENDEADDNIIYEEDKNEADDDEDEGEDENDEETVNDSEPPAQYYDYGSAKGRWSPRKRTRVPRSDYAAAAAFEGKVEVNELVKKGTMKIRSVSKECDDDDDSTEMLQYYDYEASEGTPSSQDSNKVGTTLSVKLAVQIALLAIFGY